MKRMGNCVGTVVRNQTALKTKRGDTWSPLLRVHTRADPIPHHHTHVGNDVPTTII